MSFLGESTDWSGRWFDADSAVVNPALPLTIFLPPMEYPEFHFLGTKDQSGFNAGMFFIKVHEWSIMTLANAMTYEYHKPQVDLSFLEQTSLYLQLNDTANRPHVLYQPRRWFNTYEFHHAYEGVKGDILVHFPGLQDDRWSHMAAWLDILEGPGQKEWELELSQTKYPQKIAEFWTTLRSARTTLKEGKDVYEKMQDAPAEFKAAVEQLETVLWSETDQITSMQNAAADVRDHLVLMEAVEKAAVTEIHEGGAD